MFFKLKYKLDVYKVKIILFLKKFGLFKNYMIWNSTLQRRVGPEYLPASAFKVQPLQTSIPELSVWRCKIEGATEGLPTFHKSTMEKQKNQFPDNVYQDPDPK